MAKIKIHGDKHFALDYECPECGGDVELGQNYCSECGEPIEWEDDYDFVDED